MKIHHRGYACQDIKQAISELKKTYSIKSITEVIYDELQDAQVCLIELTDDDRIELVSGNAVKNYIKKGIALYHVCYEVDDLQLELNKLLAAGSTVVSKPKPARLFNDRLVVFVETTLGLTELLEKNKTIANPTNSHRPKKEDREIVISASFSFGNFNQLFDFLAKKSNAPFKLVAMSYQQIAQDLLNEHSQMRNNTNGINAIFTRFQDWLPYQTSGEFNFCNHIENYANELISYIQIAATATNSDFLLFICPSNPALTETIQNTNFLNGIQNKITTNLEAIINVKIITTEKIIATFEGQDFYDAETDRLGHLPFNETAEATLVKLLYRNILTLIQKPYKGIIVDCDNTLWSGVIAEDGPEGIVLGPDKLLLQTKLIEQYTAGILIFIVSKNNIHDVDLAFKKNEQMKLSKAHFTCLKVNWKDKAENIYDIVTEYKISPADLVFLDDNPIECEVVRQAFPNMLVLQVPTHPKRLIEFINNLWIFDQRRITNEDKKRNVYYQQETHRIELQKKFTFQEYLEELQLTLEIFNDPTEFVERIVQLTQRVNQFNFTGIKYTYQDVVEIQTQGKQFWIIKVQDRFGDYGIAGLLIFTTTTSNFIINNFLLSCRVLGRGVEQEIFNRINDYCQQHKIKSINIHLIDTEKNIPAINFINSIPSAEKEITTNGLIYKVAVVDAHKIQYKTNTVSTPYEYKAEPTDIIQPYKNIITQTIIQEIPSTEELLNAYHAENGKDTFDGKFETVNTTQEILEKIWRDVLSLNVIKADDNFIALGGTSIDALRVIAKINKLLLRNYDISDIFNHPIFREFCSYVLSTAQSTPYLTLNSTTSIPQKEYLASYNQNWLWIIDKFVNGAWFYNMPLAIELRGSLDIAMLEQAFRYVIERHSALRTCFIEKEGKVYQDILTNIHFKIHIHEIAHLQEKQILDLIHIEEKKVFDLTQAPLISVNAFLFSNERSILLINKHHIIADGWSDKIIFNEVSSFYNALKLENPIESYRSKPIAQYYDFSELQKNSSFINELVYWRKQLAGATPTSIKTDYPKSVVKSYDGNYVAFSIPHNNFSSISQLAAQTRSNFFSVFISIFDLALAIYSGESDISIGTVFSGRTLEKFEETIGFFANTIVFRTNLTKLATFSQILEKNKQLFFEAHKNQNIPFNELLDGLVPNRDFNINPFFDIFFAFQDAYETSLKLDGIDARYYHRGYDFARMSIVFELEIGKNGINGGIYYNTSLFKEATIQQFIELFVLLTEQVSRLYETPFTQYQLISNSRNDYIHSHLQHCVRQSILEKELIHNMIERQCLLVPKNIALDAYDETLNYGELGRLSDNMASYLFSAGLVRGNKVVVLLDRSIELIVSFIACLKLGVAYIPLEPSYPENYIQHVIDDSNPNAVISNNTNVSFLENSRRKILDLKSSWHSIVKSNQQFYPKNDNLSDLAYIIYTSGSTGQPKGVTVSHHQLANLFKATQSEYQFSERDIIPLIHSHSFDFSIWEILIALCYGGKLLIFNKNLLYSPAKLIQFMLSKKVTILNQTPSFFKKITADLELFPRAEELTLRLVIFGGEALHFKDLNDWFKKYDGASIRFYNMYGNTETTVHSSIQKITASMLDDSRSIIGQGIKGSFLVIINPTNNILPPGSIGEICVAGLNIANGYLNRPELTEKVFIDNFLNIPDLRAYKTGDQGTLLDDNRIEFLGRIDKQIKLRGFRIEPSHIETIARQHDGVQDAFVTLTGENDNKNLSIYIIPNQQNAFPLATLEKINQLNIKNKPNKSHVLKNGLTVLYLNRGETEFGYTEIFENQDYLAHSIVINEGDVVLDVGANIGLFSLFLGQSFDKINLFSFEPIPPIYDVLSENLQLYNIPAKIFNFGLSNKNTTEKFVFFPNNSVMSGAEASTKQSSKTLQDYLAKTKNNIELTQSESDMMLENKMTKEYYDCQLKTLSTVIAENNINCIDLLKIDVEGSELLLLQGITEQDWLKIKQIVIEVDIQQVDLVEIEQLLETHGYKYAIDQSLLLKGTDIYLVFATRDKNSTLRKHTKINFIPKYKYSNYHALQESLNAYLINQLPQYLIPKKIFFIDHFPLTYNGKINAKQLINVSKLFAHTDLDNVLPKSNLAHQILKIWKQILNTDDVSVTQNFFDAGGNSFLLMRLYSRLKELFFFEIAISDLFQYPTINAFVDYFSKDSAKIKENKIDTSIGGNLKDGHEIAIVGMSGIFPGAKNVDEFWSDISNGIETITHFTEEQLIALGVSKQKIAAPNFVKSAGIITDLDQFDADFFDINPKEAALMDPQQRLFLEVTWQAIENAGYCPEKIVGKVGVYAGSGKSEYLHYIRSNLDIEQQQSLAKIIDLANDKDYLATKIAYKFNFQGEALNINTACSTSLVAIVKACQSLAHHHVDLAIAGGVSILMPHQYGYLYERFGVHSSDGHCRPFDAKASGTVPSSAVGVVVLKRLKDAIQCGDNVLAIIQGYAINNDGQEKVSFGAPSINGQLSCIQEAQTLANVSAGDITYVEAHGTGTLLGDIVEAKALSLAFNSKNCEVIKEPCVLGSVKSNMGHSDAASGITGLIKIIKMFEMQEIPQTIHFKELAKEINFHETSFYINKEKIKWHSNKRKIAAISSFGIGGTNAHIILAEPQISTIKNSEIVAKHHLITLSAKNTQSLDKMTESLRLYLIRNNNKLATDLNFMCNLGYTLHVGRREFPCRAAWICADISDTIRQLQFPGHLKSTSDDIEATEIYHIAKKWLNHEMADWDKLYPENSAMRIALPTYHFLHKKYWITPENIVSEVEKAEPFINLDLDKEKKLIVEKLGQIWKKTLGIDHVEYDQKFPHLGGDSMFALQILTQIETIFGIKIDLDDIMERQTILNIADFILVIIKNGEVESNTLINLSNNKKNNAIIMIHPGNGTLFPYYHLTSLLEEKFTVWGIQKQVYHDLKKSFKSIAEMAAYYIDAIEQEPSLHEPYTLAGWSFGGVVAFEMALQLLKKGKKVDHVFLLDSWASLDKNFLQQDYFHKMYIGRDDIYENLKDIDLWEKLLWQRISLLAQYQPQILEKTTVVLFKAKKLLAEYIAKDDPFNGWSKHADSLEIIEVSGDHESIMNDENIDIISKHIKNKY